MPQIINTNISSLNAQRNLNRSQDVMKVAMQRISSGLLINSAKDDAAGLAITDRMTTQIRGMNQASRNAADAISLAQTAESALQEVTNNLQRIRELSVQSANATNSASDRAALDQEVQQLLAEVDRVAAQTAFNNQKVLDGTFGSAVFQVGANVGETITVGLSTSMRTADIGKTADYVSGTAQFSSALALGNQGEGVDTSAIAGGDVTIALGTAAAIGVNASTDLTATGAGRTASSAYSKVQAINGSGIAGLTATANTTVQFDMGTTAIGALETGFSLTINSAPIYTTYDASAAGTLSADDVVAAINANASATGVTASYDSANTRITLTATDGRDIAIDQTLAVTGTDGLNAIEGTNNTANTTTAGFAGTGLQSENYVGTIRLTAAEAITIGGATPARIGYTATSLALGNAALSSGDETTVAKAETLITRVDAALSSVSTLRSTFGALQNRFDSTIASLQATSENVSAARSRIRDADFAAETAALTRGNILQQAGVAILAQANALPQNVLALLQ